MSCRRPSNSEPANIPEGKPGVAYVDSYDLLTRDVLVTAEQERMIVRKFWKTKTTLNSRQQAAAGAAYAARTIWTPDGPANPENPPYAQRATVTPDGPVTLPVIAEVAPPERERIEVAARRPPSRAGASRLP